MVGRQHIDEPVGDTGPERFGVLAGPERRLADEELRIGPPHFLLGQVEIERPGLDLEREPATPRGATGIEGTLGGEVNDVARRSSHFAERDGLVGGGQFGNHRPALSVCGERGAPRGGKPARRGRQQHLVLAMDHHHHAGAHRSFEQLDDFGQLRREVVDRHENLEAGLPEPDQVGETGGDSRAGRPREAVQEIIGNAERSGFCGGPFHRRADRLAFARKRERPDRGDPAGERGL